MHSSEILDVSFIKAKSRYRLLEISLANKEICVQDNEELKKLVRKKKTRHTINKKYSFIRDCFLILERVRETFFELSLTDHVYSFTIFKNFIKHFPVERPY